MLGSGTELDPYQVTNASDLNDVRNDLTAYYIQTANIDLSGYSNWVPIGGSYSTPFTGSYDGNGFTISNLTIDRSGETDLGLFCHIATELPITNIKLLNVDITGDIYVGALSGNASCDLTYCSASGNLHYDEADASNSGYYFGGLIGLYYNSKNTIIENCSANVNIDGGEDPDVFAGLSGGLIGNVVANGHTLSISKCFATGNITCPDFSSEEEYHYSWKCGGLIGVIYNGSVTIENCYATGNIICPNTSGGLIGYNNISSQPLTNCYSVGAVQIPSGYIEGFHYINLSSLGGLCGSSSTYSITSCYYDAETSEQSDNDGRGVPKTTAQMKTQSTFVGWDFASIWILDSNNNGYPRFGVGAIQCRATQLITSARTNKPIAFTAF